MSNNPCVEIVEKAVYGFYAITKCRHCDNVISEKQVSQKDAKEIAKSATELIGSGEKFITDRTDDIVTVYHTIKPVRAYAKMDDMPQNPRTEWDNFGIMWCEHKKYKLGDYDNELVKKLIDHNRDNSSWEQSERYLRLFLKGKGVYIPLYMLDHGGLTIGIAVFNDRLDSGMIGFIFATDEMIVKEFGENTPENRIKAFKLLKCEVETYSQYVSGDVYAVVVQFNYGEDHVCWGYYGIDSVEEAAKEYGLELTEREV
jgi:hypothetical protein